jgi:hypothetical protein
MLSTRRKVVLKGAAEVREHTKKHARKMTREKAYARMNAIPARTRRCYLIRMRYTGVPFV